MLVGFGHPDMMTMGLLFLQFLAVGHLAIATVLAKRMQWAHPNGWDVLGFFVALVVFLVTPWLLLNKSDENIWIHRLLVGYLWLCAAFSATVFIVSLMY
jgi:hypothetical protein